MDPFTPRMRGAGGHKRNMGLSAKEYTKVYAMQTYHTKKIQTSLRSQVRMWVPYLRIHHHQRLCPFPSPYLSGRFLEALGKLIFC